MAQAIRFILDVIHLIMLVALYTNLCYTYTIKEGGCRHEVLTDE